MARIANCDFNLFVCSPDNSACRFQQPPHDDISSLRSTSNPCSPAADHTFINNHPIFDNFENRVVLQGLCRKQKPGAG